MRYAMKRQKKVAEEQKEDAEHQRNEAEAKMRNAIQEAEVERQEKARLIALLQKAGIHDK